MANIRKITAKELAELRELAAKNGIPLSPQTPNPESKDSIPQENTSKTDEQLDEELTKPKEKYTPLEFENPAEFIAFFDFALREGHRTLHKPQTELLLFTAKDYTIENPLKLLIVAANGSGKDAYYNAAVAAWLLTCKIRTRVVITSSSFTQLEGQTENYIRTLCFAVNSVLKEIDPNLTSNFCEVKKERIVCPGTGSEIKMFVTDDPGRAEGYHPFPDYPKSELCIIINEAKTVPKDIFEALSRCTYNRWIEVSSPGRTSGTFYKHWTMSRAWGEEFQPGQFIGRRITSYDCPHIPRSKIESDKMEYGENSMIFRSKHLALFTSIDELLVITPELVEKVLANPPKHIDLPTTVGVDCSAGGDEFVIYAFRGNRKVRERFWRERDTTLSARILQSEFELIKKSWGLEESDINVDDGHVGHAIIDLLRDQYNWNVNRVLNQSTAINSKMHSNRGAENYFNVLRLLEEGFLHFDREKDAKLIEQLTSRYYKQAETTGKTALESKREAHAQGRVSPDRADAFVLAFCKIRPSTFIEAKVNEKSPPIVRPSYITQEMLIKQMHIEKFGDVYRAGPKERTLAQSPSEILRHIYGNTD